MVLTSVRMDKSKTRSMLSGMSSFLEKTVAYSHNNHATIWSINISWCASQYFRVWNSQVSMNDDFSLQHLSLLFLIHWKLFRKDTLKAIPGQLQLGFFYYIMQSKYIVCLAISLAIQFLWTIKGHGNAFHGFEDLWKLSDQQS